MHKPQSICLFTKLFTGIRVYNFGYAVPEITENATVLQRHPQLLNKLFVMFPQLLAHSQAQTRKSLGSQLHLDEVSDISIPCFSMLKDFQMEYILRMSVTCTNFISSKIW